MKDNVVENFLALPGRLPAGVSIKHLSTHHDSRGQVTEIFRNEWNFELQPVQWNMVTSRADVLRGVHVHIKHSDYLIVAQGRMSLGLYDLRPDSPTYKVKSMIELGANPITPIIIPPGVAHGFYFPEPSIVFYSVSSYWDSRDELGCYFADPDLGIAWPTRDVVLSERDQHLPSMVELINMLGDKLTGLGSYETGKPS